MPILLPVARMGMRLKLRLEVRVTSRANHKLSMESSGVPRAQPLNVTGRLAILPISLMTICKPPACAK